MLCVSGCIWLGRLDIIAGDARSFVVVSTSASHHAAGIGLLWTNSVSARDLWTISNLVLFVELNV